MLMAMPRRHTCCAQANTVTVTVTTYVAREAAELEAPAATPRPSSSRLRAIGALMMLLLIYDEAAELRVTPRRRYAALRAFSYASAYADGDAMPRYASCFSLFDIIFADSAISR